MPVPANADTGGPHGSIEESDLTARLVMLIVAATVLAHGPAVEGETGVEAVKTAEREGHPELVPLLR